MCSSDLKESSDGHCLQEHLQQLAAARAAPPHGLTTRGLAAALRVEAGQLSPALQALQSLGWTGRLLSADDAEADAEAVRHVLLIAPAQTPLAPLVARLLLAPVDSDESGESADEAAALPAL